MITVTFYKDNSLALGIKTELGILDVEKAAKKFAIETVNSVSDLFTLNEEGINVLNDLLNKAKDDSALFYDESTLTFGPAVPTPQKIICVGLNYKRHADECNMEYPKTPVIFSKFSNALSGHLAEVELPSNGTQFDFEAELVIVIGKQARNVSKEDALSYVYGYSNGNDLSVRDFQFKSSQWLLGKTPDGFCPVGPYLVSKDNIEDPDNLKIQLYLNGEQKQNSNTSDMIFNCSEIISFISEHMTLLPGDIILTGTPEGVIMGEPEDTRVWLKNGDEVSVKIENLGTLTTKIVANN
ncbi:fumarylacetoacetate hydrolase family protein [Bacillus sp. Marseille-P3661]|uniref:fumarylacetoacetate hydrolase family protein n=1 Tax=Bacillus sp. Marseille-P3661 TaxID=1936234 RepID=UPI000C83D56E|nr:fumarylacetoacetate hydrolase family protein [Bacillus sp. Marseille-P3661]